MCTNKGENILFHSDSSDWHTQRINLQKFWVMLNLWILIGLQLSTTFCQTWRRKSVFGCQLFFSLCFHGEHKMVLFRMQAVNACTSCQFVFVLEEFEFCSVHNIAEALQPTNDTATSILTNLLKNTDPRIRPNIDGAARLPSQYDVTTGAVWRGVLQVARCRWRWDFTSLVLGRSVKLTW